ncbi:methyltransferase domain-containing protein [Candidatus Parcubacteria bacterium]|nr:MAG: methyltransferase domain-containing protein [Candidatus Parcubacteria bacterium]
MDDCIDGGSMKRFIEQLMSFVAARRGSIVTGRDKAASYSDGKSWDYKVVLPGLSSYLNIADLPLKLSQDWIFTEVYLTHRRETLIAVNRQTKKIAKIELAKNPRKRLDLVGEYDLLCQLKSQGVVSCPTPLSLGVVDLDVLRESLSDEYLTAAKNQQVNYMVQEFIDSGKEMPISDLILALLEQRSAGIYHGDLKPSNIVFDDSRGIAVLVDYDQAEYLDDSVMRLSAFDFLVWCDDAEMRKYGFHSWRRHFPGLEFKRDIAPLFRNGAFNLASTTLYRRQVTTNTPQGVYHTLDERDVFADGIRDLRGRKGLLDAITFRKGERVLDIGCNAGLLCHYLHDRGCVVTGIDLDASLILAADIIARITGRKIEYRCMDIDVTPLSEHYDTVTLFSVLHHTRDVRKNARMIASCCDRIIIECRLNESGSKPVQGIWRKTSSWNFEEIDDLVEWLEDIFVGFELVHNYGVGDRDRYILEFVKHTA